MSFFSHNITQKALFVYKTTAWRVTLNITLGLKRNNTMLRLLQQLGQKLGSTTIISSYYHNYYHAKILSEKKPAGAGFVEPRIYRSIFNCVVTDGYAVIL